MNCLELLVWCMRNRPNKNKKAGMILRSDFRGLPVIQMAPGFYVAHVLQSAEVHGCGALQELAILNHNTQNLGIYWLVDTECQGVITGPLNRPTVEKYANHSK